MEAHDYNSLINMKILPLYKIIVELRYIYKIDSAVFHSSLRIKTFQTIYLLSQRDSLTF